MGKIVQYHHPITWGEVTSSYPVSTLKSLGVIDGKGQIDLVKVGKLLKRSPEHKERLGVWKASYIPNLKGDNAPLYCKQDPIKLGIRVEGYTITLDGKALLGHVRKCQTCYKSWSGRGLIFTQGVGEVIMPCGYKVKEKAESQKVVEFKDGKLREHVNKCLICSNHKRIAELNYKEILKECLG
jgi:hypothetical protein